MPLQIATSMQPPPIPDNLSPPIRDILLRCLEQKKTERPTAKELLVHPLFTQYMTSTSSKCWRATFPISQHSALGHATSSCGEFRVHYQCSKCQNIWESNFDWKTFKIVLCSWSNGDIIFYIPPTSDIWLKVCPSLKTVWYSDIALHSCACIFEIHLFTFDRQCYSIQRNEN